MKYLAQRYAKGQDFVNKFLHEKRRYVDASSTDRQADLLSSQHEVSDSDHNTPQFLSSLYE